MGIVLRLAAPQAQHSLKPQTRQCAARRYRVGAQMVDVNVKGAAQPYLSPAHPRAQQNGET